MSLHVFANFVTPYGTAANNRGDNQGSNITPLQKLFWCGDPHTTVSAEAIRFAFRRLLKQAGLPCNRHWAEHPSEIPETVYNQMLIAFKGAVKTPCGYFMDHEFSWYNDSASIGYADDDLLGFMSAEAGKEEAEASGVQVEAEELPPDDTADSKGKKKPKKNLKGTNYIRRAVLEVTRAVSLTPWAGDVTFNAASAGATPSAQKKGNHPVPYGTELHATRYQYGIALTPERLRDKSRAAKAVDALCNLGTVAGNHGRFLFDFSPEAVVIRITTDPAPRLLYCFSTEDDGKTVQAASLVQRIKVGDIDPAELYIGVSDLDSALVKQLKDAKVKNIYGVKAACVAAKTLINQKLDIKE